MSYQNSPRNYLCCQIAFMLILTLLLSSQDAIGANIAALVAGIFLGCCMSSRHNADSGNRLGLSSHEKTTRNIGIGVTVVLAALFVALAMLNK